MLVRAPRASPSTFEALPLPPNVCAFPPLRSTLTLPLSIFPPQPASSHSPHSSLTPGPSLFPPLLSLVPPRPASSHFLRSSLTPQPASPPALCPFQAW